MHNHIRRQYAIIATMTEKSMRQRTSQILQAGGWSFWWPPKVKFYECDIFGIFDCVAIRGKEINFIQITDWTNVSARRRKIKKFMVDNRCEFTDAYIFAYHKTSAELRIEKINAF